MNPYIVALCLAAPFALSPQPQAPSASGTVPVPADVCPTPPSLPGDMNGDGVVTDAGDLDLFVVALVNHDSRADVDFDCNFTIADLSRFYEFSAAQATSIVDWDLNGTVNLADVRAFTAEWLAEFTTGTGHRTNVGKLCDKSDCTVNFADYQLFSLWFDDAFSTGPR